MVRRGAAADAGHAQSLSTPVRHQGKITDWKDDKGFGFVTPIGGGAKVFVHIKSFSNRQRRPTGNELVTYELKADPKGRPQGVDIAFVGDRPSTTSVVPGPGARAFLFTCVFLAFVAGAVKMGKLHFVVLIAYFAASCVAYLAYFFDKSASQEGRRRVPESTLHLFSLVGGWPGAMLAQRSLRHKTQKRSFQVMFWITIVLNCAIVNWLIWPGGLHFLKSLIDGI